MQIDLESLRRHYSSFSDEELAAINRADLVDAAKPCYDWEISSRGFTAEPEAASVDIPELDHPEGNETDSRTDAEGRPGWLDDAFFVCSFTDYPRTQYALTAANAHDVLEAGGVPCHIESEKKDVDTPGEYRVLVPSASSLKASSILDKELFNAELETDWRTHFETLTNQQLAEARPEFACAGWVDRIERYKRVYEAEVARRRSAR